MYSVCDWKIWDLERRDNWGREKMKCLKILASNSTNVGDGTEVVVFKHLEYATSSWPSYLNSRRKKTNSFDDTECDFLSTKKLLNLRH